jgi:hypothetical protein
MTAKEIQKRNKKAEQLRVIQVDPETYYVESSDGKICYRVSGDMESCQCGDFAKNIKTDPNFKCKHLLAVMNSIPTGEVENGQILEKKRPKLDERWIIEIEGSQFVKYAGLLDYAHQIGISSIEVEPLQLPTKDNGNFAICKATVVSKLGESYTDIGDSNPSNCNAKVAKHLLRLASTRAIARALRSFTNVGLTALEELADLNDVLGNDSAKVKPKAGKTTGKKSKPAKATELKTKPDQWDSSGKPASQDNQIETDNTGDSSGNKLNGGNGNAGSKTLAAGKQPAMSEAQKRAIYNLSRRRGISVEDLEQMSVDAYGVAVENLSSKDASAFIRNLQQAA